MLALKVPVKANEEDHDADAEESGPERFTQLPQPGRGIRVEFRGLEELVEQRDGAVIRGGIYGVLLLLEQGLEVRVDLRGEACAHERAER